MTITSDLIEQEASEPTQVEEDTAQSQSPATWLGLVMGDINLIVNLIDILEVLPVPPIEAVPLTKEWFLGMANVRGNLYGVTDLSQFLDLPPTSIKPSNRIVLLNSVQTTQAAVLVDAVVGLRNIEAMEHIERPDAQSKALSVAVDSPYFTSDCYRDSHGKIWVALSIDTLARDEQFVKPSIT